jgi:hypothetical protein
MIVPHRLRSLFVALAALFACVTLGAPARAGTLQIRDDAHVLSAGDVGKLRAVVGAAPFDARLVATSEYPDSADLSRYVHSLVREPNLVAVGVDPEHRHVQVHFGVATHIPHSEWASIEHAGNDAFRHGDWEGGAESIFRAASHSVTGGVGDMPPANAARPSFFGPGLLVLLVGGAIALAIYFARRRGGYGQYPGTGYGPPPYTGGGYGPGYGVPPQGGMGPVGGGLIGAGLGGLAGYELGKLEGEREERDRLEDRGRAVDVDDGDRNYDAGGGGSSWDDGGGGGGGGGDWGGGDGGGGDSGGGGDF